MRSFASRGWYGSVTPDITIGSGRQPGEESSCRSSRGASGLATIFVSKSSPQENPSASWVGRA